MPRDARAYLADILDACEAIDAAVRDLELGAYQHNRLVRSSVERELITIGEATAALARVAPDLFDAITRARRIVDFRNQLTHEYPTVDDALVWAIVQRDVPLLRRECAVLLQQLADADDDKSG
ncbi:MAG: HepT-like ribonuclease domain-containing protein [Candidatus Eisenbacteria bacterium]